MKFVAILKSGKVMVFNVKACAELYVQIYGGVLVEDQVYAEAYAELIA
jgi:hypothetical protein